MARVISIVDSILNAPFLTQVCIGIPAGMLVGYLARNPRAF